MYFVVYIVIKALQLSTYNVYWFVAMRVDNLYM